MSTFSAESPLMPFGAAYPRRDSRRPPFQTHLAPTLTPGRDASHRIAPAGTAQRATRLTKPLPERFLGVGFVGALFPLRHAHLWLWRVRLPATHHILLANLNDRIATIALSSGSPHHHSARHLSVLFLPSTRFPPSDHSPPHHSFLASAVFFFPSSLPPLRMRSQAGSTEAESH